MGPAWGDDGIPAETLDKLKSAVVYVKVRAGALAASGSGFLLLRTGTTGYVITNDHVIRLPSGTQPAPRHTTLVFWSGTEKERVVAAQVVATDPVQDLAVLKVTGFKDLPVPIQFSQTPHLIETMPVYCFGFPFGQSLSVTRGHPAITVGKGTISSLRQNERRDLAVIQIDGDLNPGNSGGPVVDSQGRLVGVAVAKVRNTRIGMAIPPQQLARLLQGRATDPRVTFGKAVDGKVLLRVEVGLIDPLNKIKEVAIHYLRKTDLAEGPQPAGDGDSPALPGSRKVEMKIDRQRAVASLEIPEEDQHNYLVQTSYVHSSGKTIFRRPVALYINPSRLPQAGPKEPPPDQPNAPQVTTRVPPGTPAPRASVPGQPALDADAPALGVVNRTPDKYLNKTITFRASLSGGITSKDGTCQLPLRDENSVQPTNLTFASSKEIAREVEELSLKWAGSPMRVTAKIDQVSKEGRGTLQVSRLEFLDASGKVVKTIPSGQPGDSKEEASIKTVNRAPEKFLDQTVKFKVFLFNGVVTRGDVYELQTFNENEVRPMNLYFTTSRDIATQLADEGLQARFYPVELTCTVEKRKQGRANIVRVSQIDFLDGNGKVIKSFK
jgi:hypothetical protein